MKKRIQYIIGIIVVLFLVGFDQLTKILANRHFSAGDTKVIIKNVFEFTYLENRGAAWGMMSGKQVFFIILTIVMSIAIIYLLIKLPESKRYTPARIILWVLLSGAIGNLIDRIALNYVRDFINLLFISFPVFNMADIYVTVSMIGLVAFILFFYKEKDFAFLKRNKEKASENNE